MLLLHKKSNSGQRFSHELPCISPDLNKATRRNQWSNHACHKRRKRGTERRQSRYRSSKIWYAFLLQQTSQVPLDKNKVYARPLKIVLLMMLLMTIVIAFGGSLAGLYDELLFLKICYICCALIIGVWSFITIRCCAYFEEFKIVPDQQHQTIKPKNKCSSHCK